MNQREQDARLEELAARVNEGEPIDWVAEEQQLGPEGRRVVRALRVVAEIAGDARRSRETVQSAPVTEHDEEPVSDRYRSHTPSEPAEIKRKLLFGVALLLAMASVYAGLFGWGRVLQYGLAGLAVLTVLIAVVSGATGPPSPPGAPGGTTPGPTA